LLWDEGAGQHAAVFRSWNQKAEAFGELDVGVVDEADGDGGAIADFCEFLGYRRGGVADELAAAWVGKARITGVEAGSPGGSVDQASRTRGRWISVIGMLVRTRPGLTRVASTSTRRLMPSRSEGEDGARRSWALWFSFFWATHRPAQAAILRFQVCEAREDGADAELIGFASIDAGE